VRPPEPPARLNSSQKASSSEAHTGAQDAWPYASKHVLKDILADMMDTTKPPPAQQKGRGHSVPTLQAASKAGSPPVAALEVKAAQPGIGAASEVASLPKWIWLLLSSGISLSLVLALTAYRHSRCGELCRMRKRRPPPTSLGWVRRMTVLPAEMIIDEEELVVPAEERLGLVRAMTSMPAEMDAEELVSPAEEEHELLFL